MTLTITFDSTSDEVNTVLELLILLQQKSRQGKLAGPIEKQAKRFETPNDATENDDFEDTARRFALYVSQNARLLAVMRVWLENAGTVDLNLLVRASGVQTQHDYSGIGSALTRNMKKANGPMRWYQCEFQIDGSRIYKILDCLIKPLQRAFGLSAISGGKVQARMERTKS